MKYFFSSRQNLTGEFDSTQRDLGRQSSASHIEKPDHNDSTKIPNPPTVIAAVVGINAPPAPMAQEQLSGLGDSFTKEILLKGAYPLTLLELVNAIEQIGGGVSFPLRKLFLVAEGGQFRISRPDFELNARLVFTWQRDNASAPDLLLSTVPVTTSQDSLLQLIAWSDEDQSFHFFERKSGFWGWAGNSFHALNPASRGKGPFDSHINGGLVMKELEFPWTHWHSQTSSIPREAFPETSEYRTHPLFAGTRSADELEGIVKTGVARWTKSRLNADTKAGGLKNSRSYFEQFTTATSANLISTSLEFTRIRANTLRLPTSFFFDVVGLQLGVSALDIFSEALPGGRIEVSGDLYAEVVRELRMRVPNEKEGSIGVEGDTHFCFLVPERAFEDIEVAKQMLHRKLISPRFFLSLLMVDFVNPLHSERRANLLQYCPDTVNQGTDLSEHFVSAVSTSVAPGSSEAEFLSYWNEGQLLERIAAELSTFFSGIQAQVQSKEGVTMLVKLAEWRKTLFRDRKLNEFASTTSILTGTESRPCVINKFGIITEQITPNNLV